jgi:ABC-type sugar transport system permease subunit
VFVLVCGGVLWAALKIILKALECLQTFLASLSTLPATFFLLLILVVPLSSDSLGARWTGYLLLILALVALAATGVVLVVLWKYGVDQAIRFINTVRRRPGETARPMREPVLSSDHAVRDLT